MVEKMTELAFPVCSVQMRLNRCVEYCSIISLNMSLDVYYNLKFHEQII